MSHTVNAREWQNILKLLMLTMLSDGRIYERQADTFVEASVKLRSDMRVRGFQTRQMTMDWYIRNREALVDIQTGQSFETDVLTLIDSIENIPDKEPLIRALKNLTAREADHDKYCLGIASKFKERLDGGSRRINAHST